MTSVPKFRFLPKITRWSRSKGSTFVSKEVILKAIGALHPKHSNDGYQSFQKDPKKEETNEKLTIDRTDVFPKR